VKIISKSITHKMAAEAIWHATVECPSVRLSYRPTATTAVGGFAAAGAVLRVPALSSKCG